MWRKPAVVSPYVPRQRDPGKTQVLASVTNAARLLKEFGKGEREIGVSELARRIGVGKSTAHRLVQTLVAERLLEQDPETATYRLGLAMQELGACVRTGMDIHLAATSILEKLRNATQETVQVAVLDGREVVYVERHESPQTIRLFGRVGHRNLAHCTSTGKVLLAYLSEAELDAVLKDWRLRRRTAYTVTDKQILRAQLLKIRMQGYAENVNESAIGIASIAAPIRNAFGDVIAAVSVAGPVQPGGSGLTRFVPAVVEAAAAISRKLGWNEPSRSRVARHQ
jgi:IclR family transcriptional regulator, KDG regulon repressor